MSDNDPIIEKIFVKINGELIDITDLDRKAYEHFLELINSLSILYYTIQNSRES